MRKFCAGLLRMLKEARGNALWDCAKWLYRNAGWIAAVVTAVLTGGVAWIKQLPLPILTFLALLVGVLTYFVIRGIARYADSKSSSVAKAQPVPEERFLAKLEALIKTGQSLVQQWTTRLEYPEKQTREHDSKNWLGEANEFARKHLTSAQLNEFTLRHSTAASVGKKYDFAMALTQAGTVPSSEDGNLAFEIFGKVKLLERFRREEKRTG